MNTDRRELPAGLVRQAVHEDAVRRITLLRHAEKKGRESLTRLSSTGRMRAFALPHILSEISRREGWPLAPDCLIAADDTSSSVRPSETLAHLSHRLSLSIFHCSSAESVRTFLFGTREIPWRHAVVVWRHDTLLDVAKTLGASSAVLPGDWSDTLYDRLILLDFDANNHLVDTRCVYTDSALQLAGDPPHRNAAIDTSSTRPGRGLREKQSSAMRDDENR